MFSTLFQSLYLLLQCGHNVEEALRRRKMQAIPITGNFLIIKLQLLYNTIAGIHRKEKERKLCLTKLVLYPDKNNNSFFYTILSFLSGHNIFEAICKWCSIQNFAVMS